MLYYRVLIVISTRDNCNYYLVEVSVFFIRVFHFISYRSNQSLLLPLGASASTRSLTLTGALNTDWDGEGGAKNRLKEAVDSFRLEGLIVDGVRLSAV